MKRTRECLRCRTINPAIAAHCMECGLMLSSTDPECPRCHGVGKVPALVSPIGHPDLLTEVMIPCRVCEHTATPHPPDCAICASFVRHGFSPTGEL